MRIIVPGWYGMASVKWLTSIEVTAGGWWGCQMDSYNMRGQKEVLKRTLMCLLEEHACTPFFSRFF